MKTTPHRAGMPAAQRPPSRPSADDIASLLGEYTALSQQTAEEDDDRLALAIRVCEALQLDREPAFGRLSP